MKLKTRFSTLVWLVAALLTPAWAQQPMDEEYAARIKEYTTDARFLNEMVDHLPVSDSVPSPLEHFGDIIGAPGVLHYTDEIYGYLRKVADSSPRVMVRTIGRTEEDREMIEVILADAGTLRDLETYRGHLNRLADPRAISQAEADEIISVAKPIYYITTGLHSPETGSPEMVMELAYRLAVEDSPLIENIRRNVIVIFTIAEPDGRDRVVDIYRYRKDHRDVGPGLTYWGHYVAHDNNRDGFGLALNLTRNILDSYLHWKATIMHDLHESVAFLYTSTGLGPYNEFIDPITVDEWHNLAHEEVGALTRLGMPGVWTHGFYNGWAANYLIWIANNRNSLGRFYETFGNSIPDTVERKLTNRQTSREWYRSNPPLKKTMWSLRNNTNYMQSGVLSALDYTAGNRQRFVENFYLKSRRAVDRGKSEAPYAFVIPADQPRQSAMAEFVNLLLRQGLEVGRVDEDLSWGEGKESVESVPAEKDGSNGTPPEEKDEKSMSAMSAPQGSFLVRMDQPYGTLARILLDKQNFPKGARAPYDDTGWTLPLLHRVETVRVDDPSILEAGTTLMTDAHEPPGGLDVRGKPVYLVDHTAEDNMTVFRFRLKDVSMQAAEEAFEADGRTYAAGTIIISVEGPDTVRRLDEAARELGLLLRGTDSAPDVPTHELETPRIALVHTWVSTPQDAGWWRFAFDTIGIPYEYISEQDLSGDLSRFDVIVMPRTRANPQTLVAGTTEAGDPIPWKRSDEYKHIGLIDETDDVRKGIGYDGVKELKAFVQKGGVFITEGTTAAFPIQMAITRRISIKRTSSLVARGGVYRAKVSDEKSPIAYGYTEEVPVYFSQAPVFQVNKNVGNYRIPDWLKDDLWHQEVPRVVLEFAKKDLLMSGMLSGEGEMAGTPAVVDVPVGRGHVVLFANRPFWRWQTRGSHSLVFNTMLHWNDLRTGWPDRPEEDEADQR